MNSFDQVFFLLREFVWPFLVATSVIWVPALIITWGFSWWIEYIRKLKISEAKWTMVEIKIPREVTKSPMAMEVILSSMYGDTKPPLYTPGSAKPAWSTILTEFGKWYAALWLGVWPLWWSLEIASIEGNIYFFIRCEPKHREMIENLVYSQFPQAEVTEVDDYTKYVPPFKHGNGWELRGTEYILKETFAPDPDNKEHKIPIDALPIKTYVDYGLDEAFQLEENQKIDPLVPLLQALGSLGVGEQAWIQYVIQGSWAHFENPDQAKKKDKPFITWQETGRYYIDNVILKPWRSELRKDKTGKKVKYTTDDGKEKEKDEEVPVFNTGFKDAPEREKEKVEAMERKMQKPGYDCGIRIVYIAKKENFKKDKLGEIKNAFKQFNAPTLNVFEAKNGTDDGFDFPWQDYKDIRKIFNRERMFKRYVKRDFFYPAEMGATLAIQKVLDHPLTDGTLLPVQKSVLNIEELATIFHFPGTVAETSALGRIEAQKAEPPANLPI